MAHQHAPTLHPEKLSIGPVASRIGIPALFIGAIAIAIVAFVASRHPALRSHLLHSYFTAYSFYLVITLGSLLFVMIHYATRAAWSTTVRRLAEGLSQNVFLMAVLFIPVLLNAKEILEWLAMTPEQFHHDEVLSRKSGYMNPTFLYVRLAAYFVVWFIAARVFAGGSVRQDQSGDPKITTCLEHSSFPLIILTGFALTGFAFDWIMGLNPHWFSTIFGVYIFAGAMLSAFSSIALLSLALQKRGLIGNAVNHDHYHDLGKWMFAFVTFWAYIGFSQYMLIWYANIPEETQFYIPRQIGHWVSVSVLLLLVHFVIPFPGLVSRHIKRKNALLAFWAVWCLLACALDLFYLIMPNDFSRKIPEVVGMPHAALSEALPKLVNGTHDVHNLAPVYKDFYQDVHFAFQPVSIGLTLLCFIGLGGLFIFTTMIALKGKSLVPTHDPRLDESLSFENA